MACTDDDPGRESRPVFGITAPVFDDGGNVAMILGAHPLRALDAARIAEVGQRVPRGSRLK